MGEGGGGGVVNKNWYPIAISEIPNQNIKSPEHELAQLVKYINRGLFVPPIYVFDKLTLFE